MKSKSQTILLLSVLLSVECIVLPLAGSLHAQSADADPIILEVTDHFQGMWPFAGTYIHFRLYKSGRAEYEKPERNRENSEWKAVKYELRLSDEDLRGVINLAENSDFLRARQQYDELWTGVDARYLATISYRPKNKHIILVNYITGYASPPNYYPESVVRLMRRIEELRGTDR